MPTIDSNFVYDRVFGSEASQKEVYDYAAKPIINGVRLGLSRALAVPGVDPLGPKNWRFVRLFRRLRGFNGTVFAYGQTSSGKTHTMEGPDIENEVEMGVIPRLEAVQTAALQWILGGK